MRLGLNRHYWRPLPLGLEVISLESGWRGKKSETNAVRLMARWGVKGVCACVCSAEE